MPGTRLSKSQFVEVMAKNSGLTKKQVAAAPQGAQRHGRPTAQQARARRSHHSRPAQAGCRREACHGTARRHQPIHQGADDLQGQTGAKGDQGEASQGPEGCCLDSRQPIRRLCRCGWRFFARLGGGGHEDPAGLPGVSGHLLEFQARAEVHPEEGRRAAAGSADGRGHAAARLGKAVGGPQRHRA